MSGPKIILVDAAGVRPYIEGLRKLEREIAYPIADGKDHFRIDHGPAYTPFFEALGDAYFAIALDGDEVVGSGAGIIRRAIAGEQTIIAGYGCDYKIAASHRGTGLGRKMGFFGLAEMLRPKNTRFRTWRFAYGAAMRGAKGDVLRSGRGFHPLKLLAPFARLHVYFVAPDVLAGLSLDDVPVPPAPNAGLDLSPEVTEEIVSTAGRKDLRLDSTHAPWPLQHLPLGPRSWRPNLGEYLQRSGAALVGKHAPGPACFAIDERLRDQVAWLHERGVDPGATCTIVAMRLFSWAQRPSWVHLSTSEI